MSQKVKWHMRAYLEDVIFFSAIFILTMLPDMMKPFDKSEFVKNLLFFALLYGQALLHRYFIFPLIISKRYLAYFCGAVLVILFGAALLLLVDYYWVDPELYTSGEVTLFEVFIYFIVLCLTSTFAILSLFLIRKYSNELQKRNETQLRLSEMNIKYLHAQLNPHFFFNMFNNLYGVSLTEPSRAPELILKLSELMRYQLENANKETVSLEEEFAFIGNYIAMEKERIGRRCLIDYTVEEEEADASHGRIAPLLLITVIENAFKHSITTQNKWFVKIKINLTRSVLVVNVENSIPDENLKVSSTGIGLMNVRQRLELLYPNAYTLDITSSEDRYATLLVLKLK